VVVFFSVSRSKLAPYVLPACLPLAVLGALAAQTALDHGLTRRLRCGLAATAAVVGLVFLAMLWIGLGGVPMIAGSDQLPGTLIPLCGAGAVAAFVAAGAALRDRPRAWWRLSLISAVGLLVAMQIASLPILGRRSAKALVEYLRPRLPTGARLVMYRCYPQTLPAYLGGTVDTVDYRGELSFGIDLLSAEERVRRFPEVSEFATQWDTSQPIVLVTDEKSLAQLDNNGIDEGELIHLEGPYRVFLNPSAAARFVR